MPTPLRVLIVDDNGLRRRAIRRLCRVCKKDIEWTPAASRGAAITAIDHERFDRFLIDVALGGHAQGLEVLRHAREHSVLTPAIIYGGFLDQSASLTAQRLGACPLPFDGSGSEIVDALVEPPFSAYGAFAETSSEVSFHERLKDLKLSYFEQILRSRGGSIHATARKLHISQQAAQYIARLLDERRE